MALIWQMGEGEGGDYDGQLSITWMWAGQEEQVRVPEQEGSIAGD